ncbi:MAG: hypothetical protein M0Q49_06455 [Porticoccaceae bacterium]|nr:hypothetical protein [Porticoccaceae bacterium]
MSKGFIPGESSKTTITGRVDLYEPRDYGELVKVATLEVTAKKYPRPDYLEVLGRHGSDDAGICKEMVVDIKGLPEGWEFESSIFDKFSRHPWQLRPIAQFVGAVNNDLLTELARQKN